MMRKCIHLAKAWFIFTAALHFQFASAESKWTLLGGDIQGVAKEDWFGGKVSLSNDGTVLAASAIFSDNYRGCVRVFDYIDNNWKQRGVTIRGDYQGDYFGQSVALSGDGARLAVGSPYSYAPGDVYLARGSVKVYDWNVTSNSWTQIGIDIYAEASGDSAGMSLALSNDGSVLAIGAPYSDGASAGRTTENAGQVRIFAWSVGASMWTQLGTDIDGENYYDFAGTSVALSGDGAVVAIGAPYNDGSGAKDVSTDTRTNWRGFDGGQVRVYKWTNNAWSKLGADIDGTTANGGFGETLALSEDATTLAVAAPGWGASDGEVKILSWTGINWVQTGQTIVRPSDQEYYDFPVAMSGDGSRVAVGMPAETLTNATGSVSVYKFAGTTWEQDGDNILGDDVYEFAGSSISLSSDGSIVAIGIPLLDGQAENTGSVKVYVSTEILIPSPQPSSGPTETPSRRPSSLPTDYPTLAPSERPTMQPSPTPTQALFVAPSQRLSSFPTGSPTHAPTDAPTEQPSTTPSRAPSIIPSGQPTMSPTGQPTQSPTNTPSKLPILAPTKRPSSTPTMVPLSTPTTRTPTRRPTRRPSGAMMQPTKVPTASPTADFSGLTVSQLVGSCLKEIFVLAKCACNTICVESTRQTKCHYQFKTVAKRNSFRRQLQRRVVRRCEARAISLLRQQQSSNFVKQKWNERRKWSEQRKRGGFMA